MPTPDPAVPAAAPQPGPRPFHALLGLRSGPVGKGTAEVVLPANPLLANSRGDVHGGAIATLMDAALSAAVRSVLPRGTSCATVTLNVTYLLPGRGRLAGEGRVLRAGRTLVNAEAYVTDATGRLIAQAVGTFRAVRPRGSEQARPQAADELEPPASTVPEGHSPEGLAPGREWP